VTSSGAAGRVSLSGFMKAGHDEEHPWVTIVLLGNTLKSPERGSHIYLFPTIGHMRLVPPFRHSLKITKTARQELSASPQEIFKAHRPPIPKHSTPQTYATTKSGVFLVSGPSF
jgi:hypothetical protein